VPSQAAKACHQLFKKTTH